MTQEERIEILLSSIRANVNLTEGQMELVHKSLIEGQLKIVQIEGLSTRARSTLRYFPVELVREGFAFWCSGGYSRQVGTAVVAAGHALQPLKVARVMKEKNGRHILCILYQGCFLAEAKVTEQQKEYVNIYQVVGFAGRENACEAKCQRIYTITPAADDSCLQPGEEARFSGLIQAALGMAYKEDNISTRYNVEG